MIVAAIGAAAIEHVYSVGVVVATLALFFVPLALGADLQSTLLRAMTFMIVASPCAVVLATMPPLLSAIANAGRQGADRGIDQMGELDLHGCAASDEGPFDLVERGGGRHAAEARPRDLVQRRALFGEARR